MPNRTPENSSTDPFSSEKSRVRVVIVDENEMAADMLSKVLQHVGYDVSTANDGPSALHVLTTAKPTIVLLDMGMRFVAGPDLARTLRNRFPDVLIVAISESSPDPDEDGLGDNGIDHQFVKPLKIAALLDVLAAHVQAQAATSD